MKTLIGTYSLLQVQLRSLPVGQQQRHFLLNRKIVFNILLSKIQDKLVHLI